MKVEGEVTNISFFEWGKTKHPIAREFSLLAASFAPDVALMLDYCRNGVRGGDGKLHSLYEKYSLPDRTTWLKLYLRRHLLFMKAMPVTGHTAVTPEVYLFLRKVTCLMKTHPEKIHFTTESPSHTDSNPQVTQAISQLFSFAPEQAIEKSLTDVQPSDEQAAFYMSLEMLFFMRVLIPCFSLFKMFPSQLLYKARHKNITALCNLLTIDKTAIYDPKISKILYAMQALQPALFRNRIAKALAAPLPKIGMKKLKNSIGGLLSRLLGNIFHVSTTDIHSCFDCYSYAKNGKAVDPDLQTDEEAHRKAVARHSKEWAENFMRVDTLPQK